MYILNYLFRWMNLLLMHMGLLLVFDSEVLMIICMFSEIVSHIVGRDTKDTPAIPGSRRGNLWTNASQNSKGVTGNAI